MNGYRYDAQNENGNSDNLTSHKFDPYLQTFTFINAIENRVRLGLQLGSRVGLGLVSWLG